jgi:hypothetical protein
VAARVLAARDVGARVTAHFPDVALAIVVAALIVAVMKGM